MIFAVIPIGSVEAGWVGETIACLQNSLGFTTCVGGPQPEPVYAWDPKRQQYNSFELLRALVHSAPQSVDRVLGLTACDLFIPALTFVFGQAQLDGTVALVSIARLRQAFYGMQEDDALFRRRLRTEVLHEAGHTLGLIHCTELDCAMRLSTGILQVDRKQDRFCNSCEAAAQARIARWRLGAT